MKLIGNVVKQTTGNIVKRSAQYLNYEVDILQTDMYNCLKTCKLTYQSRIINQNYKNLLNKYLFRIICP